MLILGLRSINIDAYTTSKLKKYSGGQEEVSASDNPTEPNPLDNPPSSPSPVPHLGFSPLMGSCNACIRPEHENCSSFSSSPGKNRHSDSYSNTKSAKPRKARERKPNPYSESPAPI